MSLARDILLAIAPPLATQVGEGVREVLRARRERGKPCAHGRPGGRLCPTCSAAGAPPQKESPGG